MTHPLHPSFIYFNHWGAVHTECIFVILPLCAFQDIKFKEVQLLKKHIALRQTTQNAICVNAPLWKWFFFSLNRTSPGSLLTPSLSLIRMPTRPHPEEESREDWKQMKEALAVWRTHISLPKGWLKGHSENQSLWADFCSLIDVPATLIPQCESERAIEAHSRILSLFEWPSWPSILVWEDDKHWKTNQPSHLTWKHCCCCRGDTSRLFAIF